MTTKATTEQIEVYIKNGKKFIIHLSVFTKPQQPLKYIESKGVIIEIKGTENNSIDDLKQ